MSLFNALRRLWEDFQHRGQTLPEQYRGILDKCRACDHLTAGFDEEGPLCIDCAVVKALKEGV